MNIDHLKQTCLEAAEYYRIATAEGQALFAWDLKDQFVPISRALRFHTAMIRLQYENTIDQAVDVVDLFDAATTNDGLARMVKDGALYSILRNKINQLRTLVNIEEKRTAFAEDPKR